ncbi:hypothetical protein B0H11DRAFT_2043725 [Mycena galericulata]|nr:hypothetical protein B0H11DRAFT_2043725 [Mycena galericulata]
MDGSATNHQDTRIASINSASEPGDTPQVQLKRHPCEFPPPKSAVAEGPITCTIHDFRVEVLPPNYPYLPYLPSASPSPKFQRVPFFFFSGPDPPPADIGSFGDLYVAPTTDALYAYLPVDGTGGGGAWTRWTALIGLAHPYLPDRLLWPGPKGMPFSWYPIRSIEQFLREEDKISKKRHAEEVEEVLKRARVDSGKIFVSRSTSTFQQEDQDLAERDALQGQVQEHTFTIARLEAENKELTTRLEQVLRRPPPPERTPFHHEFLGFMRETLACEVMVTCNDQRIRAEDAAADATAQVAMLQSRIASTENASTRDELTVAETRITQLETELVQARRESASQIAQYNVALAENAALVSEIERMCIQSRPSPVPDAYSLKLSAQHIAQLEKDMVELSQANADAASQIAQLKNELTQNTDARTKIPLLESEIARLQSAASNDTALLRLAKVAVTEAQNNNDSLEKEIRRLNQASQQETDILKRLLAARESS